VNELRTSETTEVEADTAGEFARGGAWHRFSAAVRADHAALASADARYASGPNRSNASLPGTFVRRIGFQMMVGYRVMRLCRDVGFGVGARTASRFMRHVYSADIHWDAELAPGVIIVHGTGLVISHAARVGPGCILFQHVTLGMNIDAATRETGAPVLEANVHVGPGAVLLGPIVIGAGTKITANALLTRSVPPNSRVMTPEPIIGTRGDW
jgi:serine acetyltransferase